MAQSLSRRLTPTIDRITLPAAPAWLDSLAKAPKRRFDRFSLAPAVAIGTIGLIAFWILLAICCTISPIVLTWTEHLI